MVTTGFAVAFVAVVAVAVAVVFLLVFFVFSTYLSILQSGF
jgi:hypothetical protein